MTEHHLHKRSMWALFKQAVSGKVQHDFTKGSIGVAAFLLAVPMVLEMSMEAIFALVDIFYVSFLGFEAVTVVGLTEAVLSILYALAIGLSMGVTAMVARRIGEKNQSKANLVAGQALWLGLLVSLFVAAIGMLFAKDILIFMGAEAEVLALGINYTTIMLCGSASIFYLFLINAIFRGAGDASVAMRSLWLANGINLVLDPILIFGWGPFPEMGVTGAAVATTIGRGIGVCYQLYYLCGVAGRVQVNLQSLRPKFAVMAELLKVSVGGTLQFLVATASWVVLVRIVATYGSAAVAGYTIAIRIVMFTLLPAWGLSNAVATLVGQNLGAEQPERAEKSVWRVARYNVIFMLSVAVILFVFAKIIVAAFSTDPNVAEYAVQCLRYVSLGFGFYGLGMVVVQAFNGAGDTMTPTKINLLCFWVVQIPLAYGLSSYASLGPSGVFWSIVFAQSLMTVVGVIVFRRGNWKLQLV
ncbi:MATE family efflux transporter [Aliiglaciecola lipolytica]|uniref:Multidrug-efflux transporter n=1 Tax=Aliiglaciecola lipolytica E3 TaxID=1127673 RepID=K6YD86_9ALTE|nr:MATE family efflux transporter [Aliiglaciecola lipolytica]GAC16162.1 MATE efflux family protein [Aliiglaciecola lipolytica E3]